MFSALIHDNGIHIKLGQGLAAQCIFYNSPFEKSQSGAAVVLLMVRVLLCQTQAAL